MAWGKEHLVYVAAPDSFTRFWVSVQLFTVYGGVCVVFTFSIWFCIFKLYIYFPGTCVCVCVYAYKYKYIYIYIHTHTHTHTHTHVMLLHILPWWLSGKEPTAMQEMWVRSLGQEDPLEPGEGTGNPFQYSCLGNPMDRGTWWAVIHGVTESQTQLGE